MKVKVDEWLEKVQKRGNPNIHLPFFKKSMNIFYYNICPVCQIEIPSALLKEKKPLRKQIATLELEIYRVWKAIIIISETIRFALTSLIS